MQIIISGRHVELTDSLREHVEESFGRLAKFDERLSRIEVTLTEEKKRCLVEASASRGRGSPVRAGSEAADFRTAVDRVYEKLSRQIRRRRKRVRARKSSSEVPLTATSEPLES